MRSGSSTGCSPCDVNAAIASRRATGNRRAKMSPTAGRRLGLSRSNSSASLRPRKMVSRQPARGSVAGEICNLKRCSRTLLMWLDKTARSERPTVSISSAMLGQSRSASLTRSPAAKRRSNAPCRSLQRDTSDFVLAHRLVPHAATPTTGSSATHSGGGARYTTSADRSVAARAHAASMSSSNSSVSFFIIVPPSSSASTMVTAR